MYTPLGAHCSTTWQRRMCRASWISFSRSLRESSWAGSLTCEAALDEAELEGLAELEGGDVEAALDEAELEAAPSDWRK